jgi:hypothetical protein
MATSVIAKVSDVETGDDEKNALAIVMGRFMSHQSIVIVHSALCNLIRKQTIYYSPQSMLLHHAKYAFHYTIMFPNQFNVIEPDFGPLIYLTTGGFYDELFENAWKRRRVAII